MKQLDQGEAVPSRLSRTTHSKHFVWIENLGRTDWFSSWNGFRNANVVMRIKLLGFRAENGQYEISTELPGGSLYHSTHQSLEDAQIAADDYFEQWAIMMRMEVGQQP